MQAQNGQETAGRRQSQVKLVRVRAVDNLSLSLRSNEVIGISGESGSGKSTLGAAILRLLSCRYSGVASTDEKGSPFATIVRVSEAKVSPKETLTRVQIFSGLSEDELSFLAQRAVPRRFSAGETVFAEGQPCAGLYVVASGHVRIFKSSAGGREHVLSIEGPGSSVAELPVFDGGDYPASVTAVDDATLLFVSKQDFQSLCLAHPQVSLKVLRVVGARLRRLVGIIEELSFTTVRHRLAAFLVRLAKSSGNRVADGIEITLPANNQELAAQIGTVRELVSRNLSRFQAEGMLKMEGRGVVVTDLKALEADLESGE
jgi:CRP/FNR family transcriptional regulator, cyclic AMP receptor protein